MPQERQQALLHGWLRAVDCALHWAQNDQ